MGRFFGYFFVILCLTILNAYGNKAPNPNAIDITAQHFKSIGNKTTITGDVKIVKGDDRLNADVVIVYTDKDRKPTSYEAKGNVKFTIVNNGREIKGNSNRLVYDVPKNEYRLYDNAVVKETGKPNTLKGDEIILNGSGDYANVLGNKNTPARIIFSLDK